MKFKRFALLFLVLGLVFAVGCEKEKGYKKLVETVNKIRRIKDPKLKVQKNEPEAEGNHLRAALVQKNLRVYLYQKQ